MVGNNHPVDVLAIRDAKTLAVEIETGKSDALQNIIRDVEAGFHEVICVATSERVAQSIRRLLAEKGNRAWQGLRVCCAQQLLD